ncbi:hypothetical protein B0J14DRAFT_660846 [Halenospora varia]|nr:hypothetical protein B0J14DRAFT_660846 [Halenospora varia]
MRLSIVLMALLASITVCDKFKDLLPAGILRTTSDQYLNSTDGTNSTNGTLTNAESVSNNGRKVEAGAWIYLVILAAIPTIGLLLHVRRLGDAYCDCIIKMCKLVPMGITMVVCYFRDPDAEEDRRENARGDASQEEEGRGGIELGKFCRDSLDLFTIDSRADTLVDTPPRGNSLMQPRGETPPPPYNSKAEPEAQTEAVSEEEIEPESEPKTEVELKPSPKPTLAPSLKLKTKQNL